MIYVNNTQDFTRFLEGVEPSKYDLSTYGALMHIYNEQRLLEALNASIDQEFLSEGEIVDGLKDVWNERNIFKAVIKLIEVIIKIISTGLRTLLGIAKKFLYRANDVTKDNKDFLGKYEKSLMQISNNTITMDCYSMDKDLTGIGMTIENANNEFFRNAVNKVTSGEEVFVRESDLSDKITSYRSTILNSVNYNSRSNNLYDDKEWHSVVRYACFGQQRSLTYSVYDALQIIKGYNKNKDFILDLSKRVKENCDRDINELENLKKLMKDSTKFSNSESLVEQFQLLNRYRTQTMQDAVYTFTTLIEYVDIINKQAKSICIMAMQENKGGN